MANYPLWCMNSRFASSFFLKIKERFFPYADLAPFLKEELCRGLWDSRSARYSLSLGFIIKSISEILLAKSHWVESPDFEKSAKLLAFYFLKKLEWFL